MLVPDFRVLFCFLWLVQCSRHLGPDMLRSSPLLGRPLISWLAVLQSPPWPGWEFIALASGLCVLLDVAGRTEDYVRVLIQDSLSSHPRQACSSSNNKTDGSVTFKRVGDLVFSLWS